MILGRLRQARDPGRESEGRSLILNQEAGQQGFRRRAAFGYGGRAGPSDPGPAPELPSACAAPRPALVSFEPAGQACAVAAAGEDGGGRRGGAGGSGTLLRVRVA